MAGKAKRALVGGTVLATSFAAMFLYTTGRERGQATGPEASPTPAASSTGFQKCTITEQLLGHIGVDLLRQAPEHPSDQQRLTADVAGRLASTSAVNFEIVVVYGSSADARDATGTGNNLTAALRQDLPEAARNRVQAPREVVDGLATREFTPSSVPTLTPGTGEAYYVALRQTCVTLTPTPVN